MSSSPSFKVLLIVGVVGAVGIYIYLRSKSSKKSKGPLIGTLLSTSNEDLPSSALFLYGTKVTANSWIYWVVDHSGQLKPTKLPNTLITNGEIVGVPGEGSRRWKVYLWPPSS
jgi:hypothetical protein